MLLVSDVISPYLNVFGLSVERFRTEITNCFIVGIILFVVSLSVFSQSFTAENEKEKNYIGDG